MKVLEENIESFWAWHKTQKTAGKEWQLWLHEQINNNNFCMMKNTTNN